MLLWKANQWKDCFRGYVREATGKPTARIGSKTYPWQDHITLVEGEQGVEDTKVSTADVLNCALAQKQSLIAVLQDPMIIPSERALTLLKVVARELLELPANAHMYSAYVDTEEQVLPLEEAANAAAVSMQQALPNLLPLLEHAEHVRSAGVTATGAAGAAGAPGGAADANGVGAAAAAPGAAGADSATAGMRADGTTASAAAAAQGTAGAERGAAAAPAGAGIEGTTTAAAATSGANRTTAAAGAAATAGVKRVLTESQLQNLQKKRCQQCSRDIPCASRTCPHTDCAARQQLKADAERDALLQPIKPYMGIGAVPEEQRSTQALANVTKRLGQPSLLKQLRAAAEDTGLAITVTAVGLVKCSASYSSITSAHNSGTYVVPIDSAVADHRLVVHTHSTGGPLRSVMEKRCGIAGLGSQVPADIQRMRAGQQNIISVVHQAILAEVGEDSGPAAAAAGAPADGEGAAAAANAAGARPGSHQDTPAAAAAGTHQDAPAAATDGARQDAAAAAAGDSATAAGPAAAAPMQPPQAARLVQNMPAHGQYLVDLLSQFGYVLMPTTLVNDELATAVLQQGPLAFPVIRRESLLFPDGPRRVPMVSIATGYVCTYLVTDAQGERHVQNPQIVKLPRCNMPESVLEQWLQAHEQQQQQQV